MKFKQIQVIIDDSGKQVSPAVEIVINEIMNSILSYSPLTSEDKATSDRLALGLANKMSQLFSKKSFDQMVEDIENLNGFPSIDEMDAAHSKKEGE